MVITMHLLATSRTEPMLRITTEKKRGKTYLSVEGRLAGPWVATLEQCWRELRGASPQEKFHVDLCGVSFIDAAGRVLLKEIHRQGGRLVAEGCLNQAIVREIVGSEEEEQRRNDRGKSSKGPHIFFYGFLLATLLLPAALRAQQPAGTAPSAGAPAVG